MPRLIAAAAEGVRGQGPVVQSIISLTSSLGGQLVKRITTLSPNTLKFFVQKMREAFAKASHIFSTKNIGIYEILTFEILTKHELTTSLVLKNRAQLYHGHSRKRADLIPFLLLFYPSLICKRNPFTAGVTDRVFKSSDDEPEFDFATFPRLPAP